MKNNLLCNIIVLVFASLLAAAASAHNKVVVVPIGESTKSGPVTRYYSIPAAAFQPSEGGYDFGNSGVNLKANNLASHTYITGVNLPDGATVTKVTMNWKDPSAGSNLGLQLYQTDATGSEVAMATFSSSGDSGDGSSMTTSITSPLIDNSQYAYYLWLNLFDPVLVLYSVRIEYTITP